MRALAPEHLTGLIPYVPGKPIEETEREYGVTHIAKLASNENCLGPSPKAVAAVQAAAADMHLYPDAGAFYLKRAICERHAPHPVTPEHVVVGNGTNEILTLLARALLGPGEQALVGWPSFVVYRLASQGCGRDDVAVPLTDDLRYDFDGLAKAVAEQPAIKMVFLANPNNPTGQAFGAAEFDGFLAQVPADVVVVLDEAYAEYVDRDDYPDGVAHALSRPRTVVTRTFSKVFGLAAMRVGYAVCDPAIADVLNRLRDPFNVGALGQLAARAALTDVEFVERSVAHNAVERPRLAAGLEALGLTVTPSQANFVLAQVADDMAPMEVVYERLLKRAVIIRPMKGYGLPRGARITVGTAEENTRLLDALGDCLAP